jgi:ribosomal protein L13E
VSDDDLHGRCFSVAGLQLAGLSLEAACRLDGLPVQLYRKPRRAAPVPTPEEIHARAAVIRAAWDAETEVSRRCW